MRKGFLIYEEMRQYFTYVRRPLVIYDFAPDPSEYPYIGGKFYFLFYQCVSEKYMHCEKSLFVLASRQKIPALWTEIPAVETRTICLLPIEFF